MRDLKRNREARAHRGRLADVRFVELGEDRRATFVTEVLLGERFERVAFLRHDLARHGNAQTLAGGRLASLSLFW